MQEIPAMNEAAAEAPVGSVWHEETMARIDAGITAKWLEICGKHFVSDELTAGWLAWFESVHPEGYRKWWAAWECLNDLSLAGRTDAEAQKEFNVALRVYRDGALWAVERYIGHRKDQAAKARVEAERVGQQEAMRLK